MAPAAVRETIVTPEGDDVIVRLQISDKPLLDESATILLGLTVRLPAYQTPLLAHLERAAMKMAQQALSALLQEMATELSSGNYEREPPLKRDLRKRR